MSSMKSSKTSRRGFLYLLGIGTGVVVAGDKLFARQFTAEAAPFTLPEMEYDPSLQMMVDPETHEPLYVRAEMLAVDDDKDKSKDKSKDKNKDKNKPKPASKTSKPLPTVTAGCDKCPKCDDHCG